MLVNSGRQGKADCLLGGSAQGISWLAASGEMGKTGGLRKAPAPAACQDPVDGGFEVYLVAYGDVHRLHSAPGAQRRTDHLVAVYYVHAGTPVNSDLPVISAEPGFGAPYHWLVPQNSQVRRQAQPARMGNTLAVHEDQVGLHAQLLAS